MCWGREKGVSWTGAFCWSVWVLARKISFSDGWGLIQVFLMLLLQHIEQLVCDAGQTLRCDLHLTLRRLCLRPQCFSAYGIFFFMFAIFDWVSRLRAGWQEDGAVGHGEHENEDCWGNMQSLFLSKLSGFAGSWLCAGQAGGLAVGHTMISPDFGSKLGVESLQELREHTGAGAEGCSMLWCACAELFVGFLGPFHARISRLQAASLFC
jgi:hypothetical protein